MPSCPLTFSVNNGSPCCKIVGTLRVPLDTFISKLSLLVPSVNELILKLLLEITGALIFKAVPKAELFAPICKVSKPFNRVTILSVITTSPLLTTLVAGLVLNNNVPAVLYTSALILFCMPSTIAVESSANTEPLRSPVTSPLTLPVRLPVTLPVTLPLTLPVTLPVKFPVTLPVSAPYMFTKRPSAQRLPAAPMSRKLSASGVTSVVMPENATEPVSTAVPPTVEPSPTNNCLVSVV